MAVINRTLLAGNLTRDPEIRYTPKGTAVLSASLAVNRVWKDDSGEKREEVSFIEFVAFGRTAETIAQYFKKGGNIFIEGRLKQESWEDKQTGQKRSKVVVIADSFQFLNRNGGEGDGPQSPTSPKNPEPAELEQDDVPF